MRQYMRRYANAVVGNNYQDLISNDLNTHLNVTTRRRILGGVIEQVAENLLQAYLATTQKYGLGRKLSFNCLRTPRHD